MTILLSFWEPSSYMRLSQQTSSLHAALPTFLSARFHSLRLWLCCTILLAVHCPQCRFLRLGSCVQSSVCLAFLCLSAAPLKAYFFYFGSASKFGLQYRMLLRQCHQCALGVRLFFFFWEPCCYMQLSFSFFSPFGFVRCSFGASNDFVCGSFT